MQRRSHDVKTDPRSAGVGPGGLALSAETPGLSETVPPRRPTGGKRAGYFPRILARNIPHPYRLPGLHRAHLVSSCSNSAAPHAGAQRRDWISAVRSRRLLRPHPVPADLVVDTLNHYLLIACEGWTGLRPPGAAFDLVPSVSRCREPCDSSVDQMRWDVNIPRVQRRETLPAANNKEAPLGQGSSAASLSVHAELSSSLYR